MALSFETTPAQWSYSGDEIVNQISSDLLGVEDNLSIACRVTVWLPDSTYLSTVVYETVGADNYFTFRLNKLIEGMIRNYWAKPDWSLPITELIALPLICEMQFTELYNYGEEGFPDTISTNVLPGGSGFLRKDNSSFLGKLQMAGIDLWDMKFLTWKLPFTNSILPNQPEFLWFLYLSSTYSNFRINVALFDKDGLEFATTYVEYAGVVEGKLYSINISYGADGLNIPALEASHSTECAYFEIQESNEITEIRRYYIDRQNYPTARYLMFTNSLGGMDTIALKGREVVGGEIITDDAVVKTPNFDSGVEFGTIDVTDKEVNTTVKKNTGTLTKVERIYLRELMVSHHVYEAYKNSIGQWKLRPIRITNKKLPDIDSNEFIAGVDIEWAYNWTDRYFSPDRDLI